MALTGLSSSSVMLLSRGTPGNSRNRVSPGPVAPHVREDPAQPAVGLHPRCSSCSSIHGGRGRRSPAGCAPGGTRSLASGPIPSVAVSVRGRRRRCRRAPGRTARGRPRSASKKYLRPWARQLAPTRLLRGAIEDGVRHVDGLGQPLRAQLQQSDRRSPPRVGDRWRRARSAERGVVEFAGHHPRGEDAGPLGRPPRPVLRAAGKGCGRRCRRSAAAAGWRPSAPPGGGRAGCTALAMASPPARTARRRAGAPPPSPATAPAGDEACPTHIARRPGPRHAGVVLGGPGPGGPRRREVGWQAPHRRTWRAYTVAWIGGAAVSSTSAAAWACRGASPDSLLGARVARRQFLVWCAPLAPLPGSRWPRGVRTPLLPGERLRFDPGAPCWAGAAAAIAAPQQVPHRLQQGARLLRHLAAARGSSSRSAPPPRASVRPPSCRRKSRARG